jgi:outer membrane lipoprotein carrier protein
MIVKHKRAMPTTVCLILILLSLGNAYCLTPEEIAEGIQQRYREIKDLQADFDQKTSLPMMDRTREASGRLYLKMPGKMRWDYLEGQQKTVLITGHTLLFYDPEERQATVTDLSRVPNSEGMLTFLTGMGDLQRDFLLDSSATTSKSPQGYVMIHLLPRAENSQWTHLRLAVEPNTFQVVQSSFEGIQGERTVIDYSNIQTNVGLSEEMFTFEIPEGTDILHYPPPTSMEGQ